MQVAIPSTPTLCLSRYMSSRHIGDTGLRLPILDPSARMGWVVSPTARPLYSRERHTLPAVQEAVWASEPVWMGPENLAYTGVRTPDRLARSEWPC